MPVRCRRGALLPDLLVALTILSLGLAPSAWVAARAERLVADARGRERVALAARTLLARLEGGLACAGGGAAGEEAGVAVRWQAGTGTWRRVVAVFRAPGRLGADTLMTGAWCP
jgi:hypothetical protein